MEIEEASVKQTKKECGNRQKKKETSSVDLSCREYNMFFFF